MIKWTPKSKHISPPSKALSPSPSCFGPQVMLNYWELLYMLCFHDTVPSLMLSPMPNTSFHTFFFA